ncbi:MAG: HD domain-containing protein [Clostridia bacterium]|nr:HD domain-containing protein [Clostridia bacterium]
MDGQRTTGKRGLGRAIGLPLLLLVCLVNLFFLCLRYPDVRLEVQAGDVLQEDVAYPFSGTDAFRTDELRQAARDRVQPVYRLDEGIVSAQGQALAAWFGQYDLFLKEMTMRWEESAQEYNGMLYNQTAWNVLVKAPELQSKLNEYGLGDALDTVMAYTLLNTYLPQSSLHAAGTVPDTAPLRSALTETILTGMQAGVKESELEAARYRAREQLKQTSLPAVSKTELAGNLIDRFFVASSVVDEVETEKARSVAADGVTPVTVKKGELLFRKGTTLSGKDILHLVALDMLKTTASRGSYGSFLLYLLPIYLAYGFYLLLFEREVALSPSVMVRLCLLLMVNLALCWVFTLFESRIAPALLGTLMIAVTHEKRTALGACALMALTAGLLLPSAGVLSGETFALMGGILTAGVVIVCIMMVDNKRTAMVPAAMIGGAIGGLLPAAPSLLSGGGWLVSITAFGLFFLGAAIALVLAMGLAAIWEIIFDLPSPTKLNELLNINHPLQRRLMNSAPGTYHHCQMAALLAENGAESIGANALLAKAAAAVHDVGKLKSPRHFAENQANGVNPHDELPPRESSRIIIAHVADAEAYLQRFKVPAAVRAIVREHHGTTMTAYFYVKAKKMDPDVREGDFRYPGPKPSSKESAIVMLADSCEAAVRSLGGPSPEQVKDMVHRVIRGKMEDGQLVNCNLTIHELSRVEESFLQTFAGILHDRITYPKEEA